MPEAGKGMVMLNDWFTNAANLTNSNLYAIVDAARDESIATKLSALNAEAVSLYRGEPEETLAAVAPYLVNLSRNAALRAWLLNEGWGKSWAVLLMSSEDLEQLRRHFRHFLLVRDPDGNELYFRFYDPRVLRVYLPTCTAPETKQFFGPITAIFTESEAATEVLEFTRTRLRSIALSALESSVPLDAGDSEAAAVSRPRPMNRRLRIRDTQMRAFSEYMDKSFEKRAASHLRTEFPEETDGLTDDELRVFVQNGSRKAAQYELSRETEIGVFLDLLMLFGPDFDQMSWAQDIFENSELALEEKLERLRERRDFAVEQRAGTHG